MGYETTLILVGIRIPSERRDQAEKLLRKRRTAGNQSLAHILSLVDFTSQGALEFRHKKLPLPDASEVPDDEGFVLSAAGKWYESEKFALWLCRTGFEGSLIEHSRECDGEAWGWQFKNGRIRRLELRPSGRWLRVRPSPRNPHRRKYSKQGRD
jgi:hypothetical protein